MLGKLVCEGSWCVKEVGVLGKLVCEGSWCVKEVGV